MIDFWISTLHIECTTKGWQTAIIAADLQLKKLLQFGFILTPFSSFIFDIVFICKLLVSIFQNDKLQSLLQTCFETYGLTFNFNLETLFLFTRQAYYFSANYWFLVFFQNDSSPVRQESPKHHLQDRWLPRFPWDQCIFDLFLEFSTAETRQ